MWSKRSGIVTKIPLRNLIRRKDMISFIDMRSEEERKKKKPIEDISKNFRVIMPPSSINSGMVTGKPIKIGRE